MSGTHNILVISDLHLGEDLTAVASVQMTRDLRVAEAQLVEFLRKYTRRRADGKPWRLVINGDMVDFLGICVMPDSESTAYAADEHEYGMGRRRAAAGARVAAVLAHHTGFFRALAGFVAAGNAVEILVGNHDTELHWPEVCEALRQGVVDAWLAMPASRRTGAADAQAVAGRIGFHEWFYYEPGVAWIEHGHRYDECCSYQYNLHPVDDADGTIITNVDGAAMRHLVNPFSEASPHGSEQWSALGFLRFGFTQGAAIAWRLARGYYRFTAGLIREWRVLRESRSRSSRRAAHRQALSALAAESGLALGDLAALDRLQRTPVISNLRRLMQVLMLDKVLCWAAVVLLMLATIITLPLWTWLPVSLVAGVGADRLCTFLHRDRSVDPSVTLSMVPARILQRVDARYVVFGHTHLPVARPISALSALSSSRMSAAPAAGWYFNTGTWVPSGKQGLLGSFTHVVIRCKPDGEIEGRLCQWRDGASRAFDPEAVVQTNRPAASIPGPRVPVPSVSSVPINMPGQSWTRHGRPPVAVDPAAVGTQAQA
jgi:hypothetical protein